MATEGELPPSICPVIIPGKETSPITAVVAIPRLIVTRIASRIKSERASDRVAPFARAKRYVVCCLLILFVKVIKRNNHVGQRIANQHARGNEIARFEK